MNSSLVKQLLQFMFGKVTPEEFGRMRSSVNASSDEHLRAAMQTLWEDPRTPASVPLESERRVLKTLDQRAGAKIYQLTRLKVASIILLPLLLTWGTYWLFSDHHSSAPDMIVMTESGQKTHLILPDGSRVWLNALSSLSYPSDFGMKNRTVRLTGEGYFEVAKSAEKTFHVETDKVNIVVHGTKFNVTTHPDAPSTRVSLTEGSVAVKDKKHHLLAKLIPNQTLKVDNQTLQYEIINEDTHLTTLWSQNKCRVEDASAEEMFKRIGYWYGLNIQVENNKTKYRYGFTIKEESFREFLELINELTPLEYSINGEEVTVRYK